MGETLFYQGSYYRVAMVPEAAVFSEDIRLVKDSMATSSSGKVTSYQYEVVM